MGRVKVDYRLPEELLARVAAEAGRLGQTRTMFVERALEAALDDLLPPPTAQESARLREMYESPALERQFMASLFACPVPRCDFQARSAAAKCGIHGRTVVPVS